MSYERKNSLTDDIHPGEYGWAMCNTHIAVGNESIQYAKLYDRHTLHAKLPHPMITEPTSTAHRAYFGAETHIQTG